MTMTMTLQEEGHLDRHTQERPCEDRGRDGVMYEPGDEKD